MSRAREFVFVVACCALAVSMIAVATILDSYVPLVLGPLPFAVVPLVLSRSDARRAAGQDEAA